MSNIIDQDRTLENLKLVKALVAYGTKWSREHKSSFSLNIKVDVEGGQVTFSMPEKYKKEEEKTIQLMNKLVEAEEMLYLKRFHDDLNELCLGLNKEEHKVVLSIQEKIEKKFLEYGKDLFPEKFDNI